MASAAYHGKVNDFCDRLRQRRVEGSLAAAKGTAELLRQLLTSSRLADPHSMLEEVRSVGVKIQSAKPIGARARQGDEGTALPDPRRRAAQSGAGGGGLSSAHILHAFAPRSLGLPRAP